MTRVNADLKLVVIGGGRGVSQVVLGTRPYFAQQTAVVAVTDTGRSTGVARTIADMPAPGDLRNTLTAMASDPDALLPRLLEYRFHSPNVPLLDGMAFGNLLLAALTQMTGNLAAAVEIASDLVKTTAQVLPVSTVNTQLCAELDDGRIMQNELAVRALHKPPIRRLFLAESDAPAHPPVLEAIAQADVVVIGPGSFFTSVMATLLFQGVTDALRHSRAIKVFVCNTTTQPGQTDDFRVVDHVRWMTQLLGSDVLDIVLVNRSDGLSPDLLQQYASEGLHLLTPDDTELAHITAMGVLTLVQDFAETTGVKRRLWNKQDTIRHDPDLLGMALWQIFLDHAS